MWRLILRLVAAIVWQSIVAPCLYCSAENAKAADFKSIVAVSTPLEVKVFMRFSEGFHCVPEREPFCSFH